MDADGATLSVGFEIETGGAFAEVLKFAQMFDSKTLEVIRQVAAVEKATGGMMQLGGAISRVTTFGAAATREMQSVARETANAEKAGEGMVRQLQKQVDVFGKSASEIRNMRAELRAVAADDKGLTELAGRIRDLNGEMNRLEAGTNKVGGAARLGRHDLLNLGYQINDVIVSLIGGQKPLTVFAQQGSQIGQIAASSGVGLRGMAASVGALVVPFLPLIAAAGAAVGGLLLFDRAVSAGVDTKAMIAGLGLTRNEIKQLENTTVSTGDVVKATFQVMAQRVGLELGNVKTFFSDAMDFMTKLGRLTLAGIYAEFVGTFRAVSAIVKAGFGGKGIEGMMSAAGAAYTGAFNEANTALKKFGADVEKQIGSNKLKDLQKQAKEIKLDRPEKSDKQAEKLARDAEAVEAQIRNLYALADAYGVSGAAALIAEARVKAESAAIKGRADIEEAVSRQIRLAIAQRVTDAAKATATMRQQADMQAQVNDELAAGNVPAARAADLLRDRIADLPLLQALQAAQQTGDVRGTAAATAALEEQRAARERLTDEQRRAGLLTALSSAADNLAMQREELRLVGATDQARVRALATLRATQEAAANQWGGTKAAEYVQTMGDLADAQLQVRLQTDAANNSLNFQADLLQILVENLDRAGQGLADASGKAGADLADMSSSFGHYILDQRKLNDARREEIKIASQIGPIEIRTRALREINTKYAARSAQSQIGLYGDMIGAAKGFFNEKSKGYKALQTAEQAFRAIQFALSIKAMAQDAIETGVSLAKSAARTAAHAVEAVAKAIASLPFPANIAAGAATIAALAAIGVSVVGSLGGGGKNNLEKANDGTGSVLGDPSAKSDSIKNAIDALKQVDLLTNSYSRQMAASLRSIDNQIGGVAALVSRSGDINANANVAEGFKMNGLGSILSKIPLIGGMLGGLFGSKTTVIGSGLYGGPQALGSVLNGGFDASYFSDVQKKSKFFGITTGTKYSTQYTGADGNLENQFTLILKSFNDAIVAAAGPLGESTQAIQDRLNGFVISIGKIDLQGLSGTEIQEKLSAVFGKAADGLADAAFPGMQAFQKVGEGLFETLVRVASTAEAVTTALDQMAGAAPQLSIAAKLGLADQFDSISDFTSAVGSYFEAFYTAEEQAAAKTAQFTKVFASLGLAVPSSLAAFRALVEAQNLNTAAGQATYATLLQLAPAFADLQASMEGAKSAADIASERNDLQRQLLQLRGDAAAIRALDLAKVDPSNRALQQQIWDMQDAQEAAKVAQALADAWKSVGDTIMTEIQRIRGLNDAGTGGGFAAMLSQFNAANVAARGGDQDAAKALPGLSQALLTAAANAATSKQELDRIRAQTAASLEATYGAITALTKVNTTTPAISTLQGAADAQNAGARSAANDDTALAIADLRADMAADRQETRDALAQIAGNTGRVARKFDDVTSQVGDAISTVQAA